MTIDKELAMKLWKDIYGDKLFVKDCFGTYMYRDAYSNECVTMVRPFGDGKEHDYSWNIDHIKPKSSFQNESDADFYNNFEPMHRQNNLEKSDNYPVFTISGRKYKVVQNGNHGYGIVNEYGVRIDWKKDGSYYK